MSKSLIYCGNSNTQAVTAGGAVNFGSVIHRFGCIGFSGGNVVVNHGGYYDIDTNLTIAGTAIGTATVQLYFNGVAIPSAFVTLETTATSVDTISIPASIRHTCDCAGTITVVVTGANVGLTNAAIRVVKE